MKYTSTAAQIRSTNSPGECHSPRSENTSIMPETRNSGSEIAQRNRCCITRLGALLEAVSDARRQKITPAAAR